MTILQAAKDGVKNFSVFCNHIMIVPALKALLDSPDLKLDGFVGPGHVSTVIGTRPYEFVSRKYGKPLVVSGFEPLDILQSVYMLVKQIMEGRAEVENQYKRVVFRDGNRKALEVLSEVFEPARLFRMARPWLDCTQRDEVESEVLSLRRRTEILHAGLAHCRSESMSVRGDPEGRQKPWECKVFGTACTPETPIGSCMVSSEGACAAYYNFGRLSKVAERANHA